MKTSLIILLFSIAYVSKPQTKQDAPDMKNLQNALKNESSPYLLQHADNPVNWYPWGKEALLKAKKEDKPILVSIGYAACHWCHVMEHECFENEELARIMNDHFICIKVDREERPDIDDIYMNALHLMGQQGGWPLNVFLTPGQKPFYGGTYFPPQAWEQVLEQINKAFHEKRNKIEETANQVALGINSNQTFNINIEEEHKVVLPEELGEAFQSISKRFDSRNGGLGNAPKFPMPNIYSFLLRYYNISKKEEALVIVNQTLTKMAYGGIYDHVGGGFARYSTDDRWLVPHFEKMLYDNAQLIELYSEAYRYTSDPLYKHVVYQTIDFCKRELKGKEGNYFSSLDADSEGEEGKYYVWEYEELQDLLKEDFDEFQKIYSIKRNGNWEGKIILERDEKYSDVNYDKLTQWNEILLNHRQRRIKPDLDDKSLTGWNGLMLKALCTAYMVFGEEQFKTLALENGKFLTSGIIDEHGKTYRNYKNGKCSIDGFLEDYATTIDGLIALYQITFDQKWLDIAIKLFEYAEQNFLDEKDKFYFFTDKNSQKLIARRKEVQDNVIPSSNSIMANNLFLIGIYLDKEEYKSRAITMGSKMKSIVRSQASFMSNWGQLLCTIYQNPKEIVILGDQFSSFRKSIQQENIQNSIYLGGEAECNLPLAEGKKAEKNKTTVYVCENKTCKVPVNTIREALKQLD